MNLGCSRCVLFLDCSQLPTTENKRFKVKKLLAHLCGKALQLVHPVQSRSQDVGEFLVLLLVLTVTWCWLKSESSILLGTEQNIGGLCP
jgi:hypothetical protein